ncbi:MAG: hypothetical protein WA738_17235, partial [Candidatus Angelobacter sp.]
MLHSIPFLEVAHLFNLILTKLWVPLLLLRSKGWASSTFKLIYPHPLLRSAKRKSAICAKKWGTLGMLRDGKDRYGPENRLFNLAWLVFARANAVADCTSRSAQTIFEPTAVLAMLNTIAPFFIVDDLAATLAFY